MTPKEWIGLGLGLSALFVVLAPLLLARQVLRHRHLEQFAATGAIAFSLPSHRSLESEEPVARPEAFPMDRATETIADRAMQLGFDGASAQTEHLVLLNTDTGELVPLGPSEPAPFTVDNERLAEILQLEKTSEYAMNAVTWVECDAAAQFMKDPLGSTLLPPQPLIEEAGNPALAEAFFTLLERGGLTTDWIAEDSDFDVWYRELQPAA